MKPSDLSGVYLIEDGDAAAFRWGVDGPLNPFRGVEDGQRAFEKAVAHGLAREEIAVMSDLERDVAVKLSRGIGIRKDASGDCIIAWFPFDGDDDEDDALAAQLSALCGGSVAAADIHMTLLYLGPLTDDMSMQKIAAVTCLWADSYAQIEGCVTGLGRFVVDDTQDCIVALVDAPFLIEMRDNLREQLTYSGAIPWDCPAFQNVHGFLPHFTLSYLPKTQSSPAPLTEVIPFCADNITLAAGTQRVSFDMQGPWNEPGTDPTPYLAARWAQKAGRVLSGANLLELEDAYARLGDVIDRERQRRKKPGDPEENAPPTGDAAATGSSSATMAREPGDLTYTVTKAIEEDRYTLGPLYAPERKDAHGEWTDADTLQKAVWSFVKESAANGRVLKLQHGDLGADEVVGEWVEVMAWPYEHTITVKTLDGGEDRELTMPAGTVYLGAEWTPEAWKLVKAGKLNGWSLGGSAVRVATEGDLPVMGDAVVPQGR